MRGTPPCVAAAPVPSLGLFRLQPAILLRVQPDSLSELDGWLAAGLCGYPNVEELLPCREHVAAVWSDATPARALVVRCTSHWLACPGTSQMSRSLRFLREPCKTLLPEMTFFHAILS